MTLKPTAEQQAIIDAFRAGENLVIEAGAGTGKTSTLKFASTEARGRGIYIAYNAAIARESAASFPNHVTCKTAHSLAYGAVGRKYRHRLNGPRQSAQMAARALKINYPVNLSNTIVQPKQLARLAIQAVNRFCYSADEQVQHRHVPTVDGLDRDDMDILRAAVLPLARQAWTDIQRTDGKLKFEHDHYLKLWCLTDPQLPADFVMLDEAQDANPLIARLVQDQEHAQRIAVGDANQQLYAWRGAVDALATWPADQRLYLSQSWRFGQAVADEANKWLTVLGARLRLTGAPNQDSVLATLVNPDAVLCRTNAEAISRVMSALDAGRRPALVGGGQAIKRLAEAAITLKAGQGTDHPELFVFRTWGEVQDFVDNEDAGSDLRTFVKLIDTNGADEVIQAVDRLVDEGQADVIVSTAHKAKGREWPGVQIASDFVEPKNDEDGNQGEIEPALGMLAYVAVTRARRTLDRTGLAWVDKYLPAPALAA